ncbi:hypothetical protein B0H14DRAFT_1530959 [Mycena olivaceomarginata]|nr:hypothetical protein B0H14DRAFT_1530959 [Mycena olivaceomarginata]
MHGLSCALRLPSSRRMQGFWAAAVHLCTTWVERDTSPPRGSRAVPDIGAHSLAYATPHAADVLHTLRYRLVKDSNDFPAGRPVRARPSGALPFRSSRTAGAPRAPRTASIGNGHRNRRTALSAEAVAVAPQLTLVSLPSRRTPQFPAHSNDSATSRSVRTPGTPSTRTLSASPMLRSSRNECAHASGAHPRLSGSGNGLRKRPTSCSPNGGHGTQLTLACLPLSTPNSTHGPHTPWASPSPNCAVPSEYGHPP